MNLNLVSVKLIVLILVIESHGGVIENVYGRIKNTTTGLRQDARNVWSYTKGMVGLEDPTEEHKDGLIGGAIHSAHEKVHNFHEKFWAVDEIPNDSGMLWNMYTRYKQRVIKAKNYILGNNDNVAVTEPHTESPNEEINLIEETMDKLFNDDGTRKMEDLAFNAAVENLRKQLKELRKGGTTGTPVTHGEGIIDIRLSDVNKDTSIMDTSGIQSVANDIYDKVDDGIQFIKDNSEKSRVAIPDLKPHLSYGVQTVKDGYNKVSDGAVLLAGNALDEAAKEKDLLDKTSNKLAQQSKNLGENLKQSADDAVRLAYS